MKPALEPPTISTRLPQPTARSSLMQESAGCRIQVLSAQDVDVMRSMLAMFGEAFGEPSTYTQAQPDASYLEELLASGTFIAVAALVQDSVVRGLAAYALPKFKCPGTATILRRINVPRSAWGAGQACPLTACQAVRRQENIARATPPDLLQTATE